MISGTFGICYNIKFDRSLSSIAKKKLTVGEVKDLEEKLENCTKNCENDPWKENVEELECLLAEYDDLYDYITQSAIIRSLQIGMKKVKKITSIS